MGLFIRTNIIMLTVILVAVILIGGCSVATTERAGDNANVNRAFYRPDFQSLPEEIVRWTNFSKIIPIVQEYKHNGSRYVLIAEGKKPTDGYSVEVKDVVVHTEYIEIKIKLTKPGEKYRANKKDTYPYDLIIVEEQELPLRFIDVDDRYNYFRELHGISVINRPFVASSKWINIFNPAPNEQVKGTINLTGIADVYEGTVSYQLINQSGDVLFSSYTHAVSGGWGYFKEEIQVPQGLSDSIFFLELYSVNEEDGSKMHSISIPLTKKD